jgi:hypothetical protein
VHIPGKMRLHAARQVEASLDWRAYDSHILERNHRDLLLERVQNKYASRLI